MATEVDEHTGPSESGFHVTIPPAPAPAPAPTNGNGTTQPQQQRRKRVFRRASSTNMQQAATSTSATSAAVAADQWPSITLTIPRADYDWFQQQAKEAEYEPTLAKYLQWQLRRLAKEQRTEQECRAEVERQQRELAQVPASVMFPQQWLTSVRPIVAEGLVPSSESLGKADEALARAVYNDGKAGAQ